MWPQFNGFLLMKNPNFFTNAPETTRESRKREVQVSENEYWFQYHYKITNTTVVGTGFHICASYPWSSVVGCRSKRS